MSADMFFILGNPRSGTSLLRSLLNGHPQLVVPPESGFALWLRNSWEEADWSSSDVRLAFAEAVQGCRKFETWSISTERIVEALEANVPSNYGEAVSAVYVAYGAMRGKEFRAWGDKNNYYIQHVAELQQLFPSASFIHIVRDVRDVVCSYQELAARDVNSKYRPELSVDPIVIAKEWMANNQGVVDALDGSVGYQRIRYEDLVLDVPGTLTPVLQMIGVTAGDALSADMHLNSPDEPAEFLQWKQKLTAPVDSASVGRYRDELSGEATAAIVSICEPLMAKFGYTL